MDLALKKYRMEKMCGSNQSCSIIREQVESQFDVKKIEKIEDFE